MSNTTTVLMTVENVAAELSISEVEAQRLIATKRLPATRLGDEGQYRVTAEDLERYVKAGAAGVRLPEYSELHPDWFGNDYAHQADTFSGAVIDASQEQVPDDGALRRAFEAKPKESSLDFPIRATGAVAKVLSQPVPSAYFGNTPSGEADTRFSNWAELFSVETLRTVARQIIRDRDLGTAGFDAIYESPEAYREITDAAYDAASKRRIVFSKMLSVSGGPFGVLPVDRRASFLFSLSELFAPSNKARLIGLAF